MLPMSGIHPAALNAVMNPHLRETLLRLNSLNNQE